MTINNKIYLKYFKKYIKNIDLIDGMLTLIILLLKWTGNSGDW